MQANIISIKTFDANVGGVISFDWSGYPIKKIQCIIKKNSTSEQVYDETYESNDTIFAPYTYTIGSDSGLENGTIYNAFIRVYYDTYVGETHESGWSDYQSIGTSFKCIETPTFEFSAINTIITNSNQTFYLNYNSNTETGENLRSYIINIYNASNKVIESSGTKYHIPTETGNTSIVLEFPYQASGFTNGTQYHIQAVGETESGMSLETDAHYFTLETPKDDQFYILQATNIACQGGIQLETYIAIVDAFLEKDMGRYIFDDEGNPIMMSTRNNVLSYREGFSLSGDFTISLIAADIDQNETILTMTDSEFERSTEISTDPTLTVELNYICGYFGIPEKKGMFELVVTENGIKTVYFSNKIDAAVPEDLIQVTVTRKAYKDDGGMWNLGARIVANDTRIYARHQELNVITHGALEKYTHREIQLGYPLDYEEVDYENNYPGGE